MFFSLLVLLVGTAGGVFVVVHQGGGEQEIAEEVFVASVHMEEVSEEQVESEAVAIPPPQPRKVVVQPTPPTKSAIPLPIPVPPPTAPTSASTTQVFVPSPQPKPPATPLPSPAPEPAPPLTIFPININTAGHEELQEITGVGPAIAQRIIDYRSQNGQFQTIEDIKNVSGIGDVNFEKMKNEITVGDVAPLSPPPTPTPTPNPPPPAPESEKININTASYEELQQITGVGEVIAQRIIDYRNQNGLFQKIEDIKNVKGIGDATFEKMKDEITI